MPSFLMSLAVLLTALPHVAAECLADPALDAEFVSFIEGATSIPLAGSCCQADVCGLACPEEVSAPTSGTYGVSCAQRDGWMQACVVPDRMQSLTMLLLLSLTS